MESQIVAVLATIVASLTLPALAIAFVPPSNIALRSTIAIVSFSLIFQLQLNSRIISKNLLLNGVVLSSLWSPFLRSVDLLLLRKVYLEPKLNAKIAFSQRVIKDPSSRFSRFFTSFFLPHNTRYIGTPWIVKNVPRFSTTDSAYIPTRGHFLLQSSAVFVLVYMVIDATNLLPPPNIDVQLPESKQAVLTRLSEVDLEEFLTRAIGVFFGCIVSACYVLLHFYFTALLAVGSGFSEPNSWPPIFGNFAGAWSIRQFWG